MCLGWAASDARLTMRDCAAGAEPETRDWRVACPVSRLGTAGRQAGEQSLDSEMHHNQHLQTGNQKCPTTLNSHRRTR